MDPRHLRTFVTVAECGSFSEAARRLHVAQPALSRQIRSFEAGLGADLLFRSGNGTKLTPAGERLFPYALSLLRQLDAVPEIVLESQVKVSGRVAIGLPTSASAALSMPFLLAARSELPEVRLHLVESTDGHLNEMVQTGKLDLSVLYDPEPNPNFHLEGILIEDLELAARPDRFGATQSSVLLAELARYPLAIPTTSHSLRRLVDVITRRHGVQIDIALEIDSLAVTKSVLEEGMCYAILPPAALSGEIAAGALRSLPITSPSISRSVVLASSLVRGQTRAGLEVGRLLLRIARELAVQGTWKGMRHDWVGPAS